MIKICKENKESVLKKIYTGAFDNVETSVFNLVDDIILSMHKTGLPHLDFFSGLFSSIPLFVL